MGPRNLSVEPFLATEGTLVRPLKIPPEIPRGVADWHVGLSPSDRCHYHQTLSSVRRYVHFRPKFGLIPENALDITLAAEYDHGSDTFGEKVDVVLQGSTIGTDNRMRMRNTMDIVEESDAVSRAAVHASKERDRSANFDGCVFGEVTIPSHVGEKKKKKAERYNDYHLVHIGGITEKRHPSNVKLMHSSHHAPQTNGGYCRQSDGNTYQY